MDGPDRPRTTGGIALDAQAVADGIVAAAWFNDVDQCLIASSPPTAWSGSATRWGVRDRESRDLWSARGSALPGHRSCTLPRGRVLAAMVATLLFVSAACVPGRSLPIRLDSTPSASSTQNIVLIVADDMRFDSLWVMSTLGRLVEERGVTFNRAYVTTPLCCPSRASILTGLYARHHGVRGNAPPAGGVAAFDDRSTLATWLQAAGVRTGLIGRYLNGYESTDVPLGWDFWFALWQFSERHGNYNNYRVTDQGERRYSDSRPESYSTRVIGQQARRFLEEERGRQFMLMLTPRTPHYPATPDPIDSGKLKGVELPLPPSYDEQDVSDKPAWVRENGRIRPKEHEENETFRRLQLESLLSLDREIGVLLDTLRADGRLDRTWIIFTSDNGVLIGEHRLSIGKSCAYEECVRVPLVVVPPTGMFRDVPREDEHLVANIDLAPTIAEIMGVEPAGPVDGRSLLRLFRDPAAPWRDALVLEAWSDSDGKQFVALRTADRKYVHYGDGDEELYDEAGDPYELQDLAGESTRRAEKARLAAHLSALLAVPVGTDPVPLP
jgi:N-acetylglucosamine-6-sulfatase